MKKFSKQLFVLFLLLNPVFLFAQLSGLPFGIGFHTGYAFEAGKNSVETYVNTKEDNNSYYSQNKKFSLGGGFTLGGAVTYALHENLGIYAAIMYHFPQDVYFEEYNSVVGVTSHKERFLSASRFSIFPAFQVNTAFDKLNTFMRVGISINFNQQKLREVITIDTTVTEYYWEYEGSSKLGYYGEWGANYLAGEHILIELSIAYEGFQFSPDANKMVSGNINGRAINLDNIPEIEKSVIYEDWVSDQYSQYPDPNEPLTLPEQTFSYNNLSINLRFYYRF